LKVVARFGMLVGMMRKLRIQYGNTNNPLFDTSLACPTPNLYPCFGCVLPRFDLCLQLRPDEGPDLS
jgi:hypothetical protein